MMVGMKQEKQKIFTPFQSVLILLLTGLVIGFGMFAVIRMIKYSPPKHVHYHANFQVYINGKQETFQDPLYYQEVAGCLRDSDTDPLHRAHMHDEAYDVVHVHAPGVTWNHFFENINLGTEPTSLRIGSTVYANGELGTVTYILNGKKIASLTGRAITSEDTLLINFGNEDQAVLSARAQAITNKAHESNMKKDPASCSGDHENPTIQDRFNNIF